MSQVNNKNLILEEVTERQMQILNQFKFGNLYSISDVELFEFTKKISLATLKRDLSSLVKTGYINLTGFKSSSRYLLTNFGLLNRPFKVKNYLNNKLARRNAITKFNIDLFSILEKEEIFFTEEVEKLEKFTKIFHEKGKGTSEVIVKKELERFVIELSWKSSKIEGNTYTLLDTERLIKLGQEAEGKTKEEAIMILNHKKAFNYILESVKLGKNLETFRELENIHRLLVGDLGINHGIRNRAVGISGSYYLPLDIKSKIEEETRNFIHLIQNQKNNFAKALLSVLCISYLQSFEDGNKRTARLYANAMLLQAGLAPLSYRDVDEENYREAVLIFYEQNSIAAFKKIFIEQYIFACENYNLG